MTFQDIFKKAFLANIGELDLSTALISSAIALLLGVVIYLTYTYTFSGVIYSKNFGISLVAATMLTSVIVITLTSNIVLSLGMVGALSIVRFRTAIKEPLDVIYLFWSITTVIVCGAGLYLYATLSILVISGLFFAMTKIKDPYRKYIVIINFEKDASNAVQAVLDNTHYILRSRTINKNEFEMIIEIDAKEEKNMFTNRLSEIDKVTNVSLVHYKAGI